MVTRVRVSSITVMAEGLKEERAVCRKKLRSSTKLFVCAPVSVSSCISVRQSSNKIAGKQKVFFYFWLLPIRGHHSGSFVSISSSSASFSTTPCHVWTPEIGHTLEVSIEENHPYDQCFSTTGPGRETPSSGP